MKQYLFLISTFIALVMYSQNNENERINTLIDNWHNAAATADAKTFFDDIMHSNSIYIGTDETELWTSEELKEWSKTFFERDKAWVFTPKQRNIYFSSNGDISWFDELLDTWMGVCRGSGVLEKIDGKWVLKHYHLSITVPNDLVKDYLELLKRSKTSKQKEKH